VGPVPVAPEALRETSGVRAQALDESDRWQAALAWAGGMAWGPVIPGILWATNQRRSGSLARRYARSSTVVWTVLFVAYSALMGWGLFLPSLTHRTGDPPVDPDPWFWIVLGSLIAAMIGTAVGGAVVALRAEVAGGRGEPLRDLVRRWLRR
jgi:drug/metabolite transporter (DMT)-like permease